MCSPHKSDTCCFSVYVVCGYLQLLYVIQTHYLVFCHIYIYMPCLFAFVLNSTCFLNTHMHIAFLICFYYAHTLFLYGHTCVCVCIFPICMIRCQYNMRYKCLPMRERERKKRRKKKRRRHERHNPYLAATVLKNLRVFQILPLWPLVVSLISRKDSI